MQSIDSDWMLKEALSLCAEENQWTPVKNASSSPSTNNNNKNNNMTLCEIYTKMHAFPKLSHTIHNNNNLHTSNVGLLEEKGGVVLNVLPVSNSPSRSISPTLSTSLNTFSGIETRLTFCKITKVITTMRCSLEAFRAFITTPQNVQYHEDGVLWSDVIEEIEEKILFMHTAYRRIPAIDIVTMHRSASFHLPEALKGNSEALEFFVQNVVMQRGKWRNNNNNNNRDLRREEKNLNGFLKSTAAAGVNNIVDSNSDNLLPSEIYVYAIRSVNHNRAPPSKEYIRGCIHLSAFIAYEIPDSCVELIFIHAPDEHAVSAIRSCEEKIIRIKNLCELLQRMMSRGTLHLNLQEQQQVEQEEEQQKYKQKKEEKKYKKKQLRRSNTTSTNSRTTLTLTPISPEPREPSYFSLQMKRINIIPRHLTPIRQNIIIPLISLHNSLNWRLVLAQEGCEVEECEARSIIAAPPFLKAYRVSTNIISSLATFYRLVGDPLQTHRYDAFSDTVTLMGSRDEGEVIYGRRKRIAAYASNRDYCVIVARTLLQPSEARELKLLSYKNDLNIPVYVQNAIQCKFRPLCDGYERQVVYAFGYIAFNNNNSNNNDTNTNTTNTSFDIKEGKISSHLRAYHIVCVDSKDASDSRLEMATIQEHCTRMAWIRQVCEDSQEIVSSNSIGATTINSKTPAVTFSSTINNKKGFTFDKIKEQEDLEVEEEGEEGGANFTEIATLEEFNSFIQTQDNGIRSSAQADSDMTFEELEGIFEPQSEISVITSNKQFRRITPVKTLHTTSVPHSGEAPVTINTTADPNSWIDTEKEEQKEKEKETESVSLQRNPSKKEKEKEGREKQQMNPRNSEEFLQVDILACRHLPARHIPRHHLFIILRTAAGCARTGLIPLTENIKFNNERISFIGPHGDALTLTAVVRTNAGRLRRLGTAVISLLENNLLNKKQEQPRWVGLVARPGRVDAYLRGEIQILIYSGRGELRQQEQKYKQEMIKKTIKKDNNNNKEEKEQVEEESLRRRILQVLTSAAAGRRDLHKLDWIIGKCRGKTPKEVDAMLARYKVVNDDSDIVEPRDNNNNNNNNIITLTVVEVRCVTTELGLPLLNSPTCYLLVEINNGVSLTTRIVVLQQQQAVFNESLEFEVNSGEVIRLILYVGALKIGEVMISSDQRDGIQRSHTLVRGAGTNDAAPCGSVVVIIHNGTISTVMKRKKKNNNNNNNRRSSTVKGSQSRRHHYRSSSRKIYDRVENENRITRLRLLLWKHARNSLHKIDVIAASISNLDNYIKSIGPEPQQCDLRLSLRRWDPLAPAWDSPAAIAAVDLETLDLIDSNRLPQRHNNFSKRSNIYAIIQAGFFYCKTSIVRTNDTGVAQFDDPLMIHGLLPERDELIIAIINKGLAGVEDTIMGLTVFSLRTLVQQQTIIITVPLVRLAGSNDAHFRGSLQVELFAINFGGVSLSTAGASICRPRIQRLLYRYAPQKLHRVECLLAEHNGHEGELVRSLVEYYGPDILSSPMEIRLIGIRDFVPACSCYVKVYLNGEPVLRTSQQAGSMNINFSPNDSKNTVIVALDDPQHARLRFKVAQYRYLQSITVSFAEIRLRNMVAGSVNDCWISLFDNNGNNIGRLGVALKSNGFIRREADLGNWDDVENDIVLLLKKYRPNILPFLQPMMTDVNNLASAHTEIRSRILSRPIAATVYIYIDSLNLNNLNTLQQKQEIDETEYTITASFDSEDGSITWCNSMQEKCNIIRLDIPEISENGNHELSITVQEVRGTRSLSRSGRGKLRSTSRGSRANNNNSPRHSPQLLPPTELGRVVISLRALLSSTLYDNSERVTLPLVSFTQSPSARMTLQQQWILQQQQLQLQQQNQVNITNLPCSDVVGEITFSVRLPTRESIPAWLQLNVKEMEKHAIIDRAYIRYYEEGIRKILAHHEPQTLLDLHYTFYERDVAHGQWNLSLRDWKRVLMRRFRIVKNTSHSPLIPPLNNNNNNNIAEIDSAVEIESCDVPPYDEVEENSEEISLEVPEPRRTLF